MGLSKRPEVAKTKVTVTEVNGEPATANVDGDALMGVSVPETDGNRVTAMRLIINTTKLQYLARQLG